MELAREIIEGEIKVAEIALKSYEEGVIIQTRVLKMFKAWLKEYPKALNKSDSIG